jgi:hypothetical protein
MYLCEIYNDAVGPVYTYFQTRKQNIIPNKKVFPGLEKNLDQNSPNCYQDFIIILLAVSTKAVR